LKKCEPDDTLIRFTNLQTGWGPPTTHPVWNSQIYLMTTGRGGVQFTTYKPDDTPHPVHPVNNLWTGRQAVRFLNFKKWEPDSLIRVFYQKFQNCLIKKGYLGNFNKDSYGIKILYKGAGREYGGGGRIYPLIKLETHNSWAHWSLKAHIITHDFQPGHSSTSINGKSFQHKDSSLHSAIVQ